MNTKNERLNAVRRNQQRLRLQDERWELRLYVAGESPKAGTAFSNLKLICEERLKGKYHITVIDLEKHPQVARIDQILAIPTLVRKVPLPVRNIIGDLSNTEGVLHGLGLLAD